MPEEKQIGKVTHYFGNVSVAALSLTDALKVGDTIHIKGRTSDFVEKVDSMQVDHKSVEAAGPGENVAIKVKEHAREHDVVYKVIG
jgi:putative protease